jgi:hypothetical protein
MIDKVTAFNRIHFVAKTKFEHRDYYRTVNLRNKYRSLITGEDSGSLLVRFNLREDPELFAQRVALTQLITPAICNVLINPAQKVPGVKPKINTLEYVQKNDEGIKKLQGKISKYYGELSLDDYLEQRYIVPSYIDPNGWILTQFNNHQGRLKEKTVYSTEISCEDAVDFSFANNDLQYLVVRRSIKVEKVNPELKPEDGFYYVIYSDNDEVELEQVDVERLKVKPIQTKDKELEFPLFEINELGNAVNYTNAEKAVKERDYYILLNEKTLFKVRFYEPKSGRVPAERMGWKPDPYTQGRTCVNGFHSAMPYLMKSVKTVSELDLSQSLHVFLQKIAFQPRCKGTVQEPCKDGYIDLDAKVICPKCKGTTFLIHTSGQDALLFALPKDPTQMFDLSKMIHYVDLPIDIVKWLDEYLDKIGRKAIQAVYNSDMFMESSIVKTATEKGIDMESVYDALQPLAAHYAKIRTLIVKLIAVYNTLDSGLHIVYKFPKNFRLEKLSDVIATIQEAKNAGVDNYVLQQLNEDAMELMYQDQPEKMTVIRVKQRFSPFAGMDQLSINQAISSGDIPEFDRVLYRNFNRIFNDLEEAYPGTYDEKGEVKTANFYDMAFTRQKELIAEKVNALIETINTQKAEQRSVLMNAMRQDIDDIPGDQQNAA